MPSLDSTYPHSKRIDQMLCSEGDGTGVIDFNKAGITITGATTADPVVCTAVGHGLLNGEYVWIDGATGTTEINGLRKVTNKAADTFELEDLAGDAIASAGTFGGTVDMQRVACIKPPATETYGIVRMNVWAGDASAWIVGGMLGLAALSNGLVIEVYDDTAAVVDTVTPTPIKSWADWTALAGVDTGTSIDITNNKIEANVRATFAKSGPSIYLDGSAGEMLVVRCQDDLDGLSFFKLAVQGTK